MNTTLQASAIPLRIAALGLLLFAGAAALAQTPVDENGNPLGPVLGQAEESAAADDIELLSAAELETLVGPIALYPDDLLAIVLPASTYPLEIVQAARYLEDLEQDSSLTPDDSWDDSVVALLNYPEVVRMMSEDIDWTWRLGEAVVAQQTDVVAAVETFRDRAYAAGNLQSDDKQTVTRSADDVIEIQPVEDDVIYVPYYEPEQVVVYQPRRVYHYYPEPYPVYYYPYPAGHHFVAGYFWGVTTAFRIGWYDDLLHVHHHSFHGHPYFGWNYYGSYWRRPSITVFNNYYGTFGYRNVADRYRYGSYWRPRYYGGARPGHYGARSRYYTNHRSSSSRDGYADRDQRRYRDQRDWRQERRDGDAGRVRGTATGQVVRQQRRDDARHGGRVRSEERRGSARAGNDEIRFRPRDNVAAGGERRRAATERRGATPTVPRAERRSSRQPPVERRGDAADRRSAASPGDARRESVRRQLGAAAANRPATAPRATGARRDAHRAATPGDARSRPVAPARRAAPPRVHSAPTQRRAAPTQRRAAPTERRAAPVQRRAAPTERRAAPTQRRAAPTERRAAPTQRRAAPTQRRAAPTSQPRRAAPAPRASGNKGGNSRRSGPARSRQRH